MFDPQPCDKNLRRRNFAKLANRQNPLLTFSSTRGFEQVAHLKPPILSAHTGFPQSHVTLKDQRVQREQGLCTLSWVRSLAGLGFKGKLISALPFACQGIPKAFRQLKDRMFNLASYQPEKTEPTSVLVNLSPEYTHRQLIGLHGVRTVGPSGYGSPLHQDMDPTSF